MIGLRACAKCRVGVRVREKTRAARSSLSLSLPLSLAGRSADQHGLADFPVLAAHLLQNDRMPARVALIRGHVILPGPAAEPQLLDQVEFAHYTTAEHGP